MSELANAVVPWLHPATGLVTVLLAVHIPEPSYAGATKDRLDGAYPRELVRRMVTLKLPDLLAAETP